MPGTTTLQGFAYCLGSDNPKTIDDTTKALAEGVEKKVVQVYADSNDRNTKLGSPTGGMLTFLTNPGALDLYVAGVWIRLWPVPVITSGSAVPANSVGKDGDIFFVV